MKACLPLTSHHEPTQFAFSPTDRLHHVWNALVWSQPHQVVKGRGVSTPGPRSSLAQRSGAQGCAACIGRTGRRRNARSRYDTSPARSPAPERIERQRSLKQRGASHADYGQALAVKGELLLAEDALPKAGQVLKTSLRIMEARLGKDTYRQFDALEALAQVEESRKRYSEALALYERLLTAFDGLYGSGHVYSTRPLTGLARVLSKLDRNEEARAFAVRAEVVMNAQ